MLLEEISYGFDFSNNSNVLEVIYGYDVNDVSNYNLSDGWLCVIDVLCENDMVKFDVIYLGDEVIIKVGFVYNDCVVIYSEE